MNGQIPYILKNQDVILGVNNILLSTQAIGMLRYAQDNSFMGRGEVATRRDDGTVLSVRMAYRPFVPQTVVTEGPVTCVTPVPEIIRKEQIVTPVLNPLQVSFTVTEAQSRLLDSMFPGNGIPPVFDRLAQDQKTALKDFASILAEHMARLRTAAERRILTLFAGQTSTFYAPVDNTTGARNYSLFKGTYGEPDARGLMNMKNDYQGCFFEGRPAIISGPNNWNRYFNALGVRSFSTQSAAGIDFKNQLLSTDVDFYYSDQVKNAGFTSPDSALVLAPNPAGLINFSNYGINSNPLWSMGNNSDGINKFGFIDPITGLHMDAQLLKTGCGSNGYFGEVTVKIMLNLEVYFPDEPFNRPTTPAAIPFAGASVGFWRKNFYEVVGVVTP